MDNYDVGKSNDKDVNVHDNPLNLQILIQEDSKFQTSVCV